MAKKYGFSVEKANAIRVRDCAQSDKHDLNFCIALCSVGQASAVLAGGGYLYDKNIVGVIGMIALGIVINLGKVKTKSMRDAAKEVIAASNQIIYDQFGPQKRGRNKRWQ